jgi:hypothetical protein
MSSKELATFIRTIQDEQTLAARAIIDRWKVYFQNTKHPTADPERPRNQRPSLHFPGLSKR